MPDKYPIIQVPKNAAQATEAMGTKFKFWFDDPHLGRCLFKQIRPLTGEDWSEKVAAELCALLELPHARYELAEWQGMRGTASPSFVPLGGSLTHGNELLASFVQGYPGASAGSKKYYRVSQHTLDRALQIVTAPEILPPIRNAPNDAGLNAGDVFVGYLLLDAWIGNTDRHHENWGLLRLPDKTGVMRSYLAPTYDHASSLGSHEADGVREQRLSTKDRGYNVEAYSARCRCAFYATETDTKPLLAFDAFRALAGERRGAAVCWLEKLRLITDSDLDLILARVPENLCSPVAAKFALQMLRCNRSRLVHLLEEYVT